MFALTNWLVIGAVCVGLATARHDPDPKQKDASAKELKELNGKWEVESATLGGRAFPKTDPPNQYEINGSVMKNLKNEALWILELDPSKDPKRMTQTQGELTDGKPVPKADGQVNKCVYSVEKDKITTVISWGTKEEKAEFPKTLTPQLGDPVMVIVMKRISK
jgi:uncharacterized protein (TIGR03067 family)